MLIMRLLLYDFVVNVNVHGMERDAGNLLLVQGRVGVHCGEGDNRMLNYAPCHRAVRMEECSHSSTDS